MEKKRSKGVLIFGSGLIAIGAIVLVYFISLAFQPLDMVMKTYSLPRLISVYLILMGYYLIPSLFHFIIGIGIFRLKAWARIASFPLVALSFFYIAFMLMLYLYKESPSLPFGRNFYWIVMAIYLVFIIGAFIFFTRPKVKEQFR